MHDILEGTLQYEVKEMLYLYTVAKKYFSLSILNRLISEFPYHYSDASNKPSVINLHSTDNKLNQEGTDMLCVMPIICCMCQTFLFAGLTSVLLYSVLVVKSIIGLRKI